jgi:hypothetical protein
LAALISASENMTFHDKTLCFWMQSIKALGDLGIAEEAIEASTGGSTEQAMIPSQSMN